MLSCPECNSRKKDTVRVRKPDGSFKIKTNYKCGSTLIIFKNCPKPRSEWVVACHNTEPKKHIFEANELNA